MRKHIHMGERARGRDILRERDARLLVKKRAKEHICSELTYVNSCYPFGNKERKLSQGRKGGFIY
jgi:hypothetical protein